MANIWKLQENTVVLCKIISQNVGGTYREASGEHRGTVQNGCETLRISAIRGSGYDWSGKLKRPPLPSGVRRRMWNIRMECRRRISDVIHPGGMAARSPIRTPSWRSTWHSRSSHPDDSISYPNMLSGWKRQPATAHAALRWCVWTPCALPWIAKNSPQSWIALVIKKLSKHQNLTQFD